MKTAIQITAHNEFHTLDLDAPEGAVKVLQKAVDGYFAPITINEHVTMWVNDEGLLRDYPVRNHFGQEVFDATFGFDVAPVVGDIVFTGPADDEGDTFGLSEDWVTMLTSMYSGSTRYRTGVYELTV